MFKPPPVEPVNPTNGEVSVKARSNDLQQSDPLAENRGGVDIEPLLK
jgi:hypothetical protein